MDQGTSFSVGLQPTPVSHQFPTGGRLVLRIKRAGFSRASRLVFRQVATTGHCTIVTCHLVSPLQGLGQSSRNPGRRFAANAAPLCPGLDCGCPYRGVGGRAVARRVFSQDLRCTTRRLWAQARRSWAVSQTRPVGRPKVSRFATAVLSLAGPKEWGGQETRPTTRRQETRSTTKGQQTRPTTRPELWQLSVCAITSAPRSRHCRST